MDSGGVGGLRWTAEEASTIGGIATVSLLHSFIPTHWLPFSIVARAQRWPLSRTLLVSVLDNVELSILSGSELKENGSPSSGCGGTISPSCRFGKSGNTSVLKEVAENSRGKFPAKFRTTENKGRKLFSSAKTSERDEREELAGTQDKRSARSIQKCIPRPPAGYTQKKVPNSSATAQVSRTPKKSQPSLPMIPRSTSSVTNISKSNIKLAPVKTEHTRRVEGLPPKSKIKPASLTKSSGPNVEKDVVVKRRAITGIGYDDEVPFSGRKRSVRERLGSNVVNSDIYDSQRRNKRQQTESNSSQHGDDDRQVGRDDLRLKLMRKGLSQRSGAEQNGVDLREKLSRNSMNLPRYGARGHVPESRSRYDAREKVPESRSRYGLSGRVPETRSSTHVSRMPSARSADDLFKLESSRKPYSSWTADGRN